MTRRRSNVAFGLILILLGGFFFAVQFVPGLSRWVALGWPMFVIAAGGFLLLIGLLTRVPGLAVPAAIVGGIGGLLAYQNATGDWDSWAYAWTLIPGFVGVGSTLSGLLAGKGRRGIRAGVSLVVLSAVLFAIFGSFLGGPAPLRQYWPALLILVGVAMVVRAVLRR